MLAVHVSVKVKEDCVDGFLAASLDNAINSVQEEGVARFDVIQDIEDKTKFSLVEVYKNAEAPAKHKETQHYKTWRETVADMMAVPRTNIKYKTVFPSSEKGWSVPQSLASGTREAGEASKLLAVHVFVTVKEDCIDAFMEASINNAANSVQEEGVARFDVIQEIEDKTKFSLVEVYKNAEAPAKHKETQHYKTWRETVVDMMAVPRTNIKFVNHFPRTDLGWSS